MEMIIKEFDNYVEKYLDFGRMIDLKIKHTLRVMKICEKIALSLNMTKEDVKLASICGLLHDIARFEQIKQFNTFNDRISFDHGDKGVEILKENNFIKKFDNDNNELILKTVKYHNKYKVGTDVNERELLFCNIVRDADKLDILYLFCVGDVGRVKNLEPFNDYVYNNLITCNNVLRKDDTDKMEFLGIELSFAYDFNFKYSYQYLIKHNYFNSQIDYYLERTDNKLLQKQFIEIKNTINKYIEGRC